MNDWLSIIELVGLSGLPSTRRRILEKAKRERWQSRPRKGRGGGYEYHISSLPPETQEALTIKATNEIIKETSSSEGGKAGKIEAAKLKLKKEIEDQARIERRTKSLIKSEGLKDTAKSRMNAKIEIIKMWELFFSTSTTTKTASQFLFCEAYNSGELTAPDWVKSIIKSVSQGSLQRWCKTVREEGIARLAGAYGNRKEDGIISRNREIREFILSMLHDFPHCNAKHVCQGIAARFENHGFALPSHQTVKRWMNKWKQENKQLYTYIENPDKWRDQFMTSVGKYSENVTKYLELWEMDSTPADIMLDDGRYTIIGLIDVWSRRLKLLVSKTSKSSMVAALIRHCIINWGVPETIKTDNGADYASHHIVRTLEGLNIPQKFCTPFHPWEKGHIERAFGTFSRGILELVSGFIGHNVAERKAIEERKSFADRLMKKGKTVQIHLTASQLQYFCDQWTDNIYFHETHSGTNKSPFEMVNSWQEPIRKLSNIRALDLLLAEAPGKNGERHVSKKGIALDNFMYWADELIEYIGQKVRVKYDPMTTGRIQVYNHDMDLICVAECPAITGIPRAELAKKAAKIQKKRMSEAKANLKSITRKNNTKNISNEILQHYAEKAEGITTLPKQTVEYTSKGLESAADAVATIDAMKEPVTFDEINAAGSENVNPEAEAKVIEMVKFQMKRENASDCDEFDQKMRVRRYEDLLARNFENISEEDDNWRKSWEETAEYDTWKLIKKLNEENSIAQGKA